MTGTQVGAYRLLHQIGAGGMGAVWLAEHAMLGRRAAVKILHKDYSSRSEIVSRFFNEARAATSISDPGIVQIFDFGHHTDGTAYIVMELLEGVGLDRRVREHGPMQPFDALRIIRQVASSLGAAHARGIVHRDLKPENIFLVRDAEVAGGERAKILDFGIAKLQGDAAAGWRTNTAQVMGTPLYMSPEQCRGAGLVDQRADIYSLGCMLFVLVTGRPPFWAEGAGDLIAMHLREPPPLASKFSVRVTPELDHLIGRCLEKDPAKRFSTGTELASAIAMLLGGAAPSTLPSKTPAPITAPEVSKAATTLSSSTGALVVPAQTPMPTAAGGKRRALMTAGLVGVALVGGIAAFAIISSKSTPDNVAKAEPPVTAPADAAVPVVKEPIVEAPPPDTRAEMSKRMLLVASGFMKWSASHKGAPCPTAKDLKPVVVGAAKLDDSWGHEMKVTCTDQPATQIIGLVSAGPDGVAGNRDDVASWTLGEDVTGLLEGARWVAKQVKPRVPPAGGSAATGSGSTKTGVKGDKDGDGIPDER